MEPISIVGITFAVIILVVLLVVMYYAINKTSPDTLVAEIKASVTPASVAKAPTSVAVPVAAVVPVVSVVAAPFTAPAGSCSSSDTMCSNLTGASGYVAALQGDGNLIMMRPGGGVKWGANSRGGAGSKWKVSTDGRIVVVNSAGQETWSSNAGGQGVAPYYAQVNGVNLGLYDSTNKRLFSDSNGG